MDLNKYWHPIKNGNLKPLDFKLLSNKKAWFQCPVAIDHVWHTNISKVTLSNSCPYCCGRRICESSSLASTHPELAKQLHPKNIKKANELRAGCKSIVWWRCEFGHEWRASLCNRTVQNTNCPFCCNQKISIENSLATTHPNIILEWDFEKNKLSPEQISSGSNKKVAWKCSKNHKWLTSPNNRCKKNRGCPFCSGKFVCETNCFSYKFPCLLNEWDYDKNEVLPSEITAGANKKIWWICSKNKNHKWQSFIYHRTGPRKTGCPYCNESKGEIEINKILENIHPNFTRQYKNERCKNVLELSFDFALFQDDRLLGLIEYNGVQHYKPIEVFGGIESLNATKKNDLIKVKYCVNHKIPLCVITYKDKKIKSKIENFLKVANV
jgi:hypothetical protein